MVWVDVIMLGLRENGWSLGGHCTGWAKLTRARARAHARAISMLQETLAQLKRSKGGTCLSASQRSVGRLNTIMLSPKLCKI